LLTAQKIKILLEPNFTLHFTHTLLQRRIYNDSLLFSIQFFSALYNVGFRCQDVFGAASLFSKQFARLITEWQREKKVILSALSV
jgi:hypothetical protein